MPAMNPSKDAMSVVMVQFSPEAATTKDTVDRNIKKIEEYVVRATNGFPGVDLIVFPEYSTHGFGFDPYATHLKLAESIPGESTEKFGAIAKKYKTWLCVSIVEKNADPEKKPYNSMVLVNSEGKVAMKYRKMMPWCPKEPWTPGETMNVCEGPKNSKIAMMLCSDMDYPETGREAAWKGANVILRPAKYMYPWDHIWDITNQVRAYENMCYVVSVNHTGQDNSYSYFGRSMVTDYDGNILCKMGDNEGMTKVDILPKEVEAIRKDRISNNYLYGLKHRGFTGVPPHGFRENPFTVYSEWDKIPKEWDRAPTKDAENIAQQGRESLAKAKTKLKQVS